MNEQILDAIQQVRKPLLERIAQLKGDSEMLVAMLEVDQSAFIAITEQLDEHPENYERACLCATCRGYS